MFSALAESQNERGHDTRRLFDDGLRAAQDSNGAAAVSLLIWIMFTAANLATVSYSLTVSSDLVVAGVFALKAVLCFAITALVPARSLERRPRAGAQRGNAKTGKTTNNLILLFSYRSHINRVTIISWIWVETRRGAHRAAPTWIVILRCRLFRRI